MQNGFATSRQTQHLGENIVNFISKKPFDCIIATRFINTDKSIYEKQLNWKHLKTREEQNLFPGIQENIHLLFDKNTYSCVNKNFLKLLTKANNNCLPEEIYIMGVDTDCCVLTTASNLFDQGIRPIVLKKYCESNGGPDSHAAGLLCLKRLIGKNNIIEDVDFLLKNNNETQKL